MQHCQDTVIIDHLCEYTNNADRRYIESKVGCGRQLVMVDHMHVDRAASAVSRCHLQLPLHTLHSANLDHVSRHTRPYPSSRYTRVN